MRPKLYSVFFIFALAVQAHAISFISTNSYLVAENEVVAEEQWVSALLAETEGTFKKDLFIVSGGELVLNGTYEGNIWGANSAEVKMGGDCKRNLRLIGKTVRIAGSVDGNLMAAGDTISITTNSVIQGSIQLLGNSIILEGTTQGDVSITASRIVTLGGNIKGNVSIIAPDIVFTRNTHISGDLVYTASKELVPAEGIVGGTLKRSIPQPKPAFSTAQLGARFMWFIAALIAGIPFISLFPMTTAISAQLIRTVPWKCLWVGALFSLALPIFGIMSISSVIGVPLGASLLGAWAFMVYISRIIMGLVIGTLILRSANTSIGHVLLAMVTGLAVIYTATSIPAISSAVHITVISMGSGALLLGLIQKRRLIIQMPEELKRIEELQKQQNQKQEDK
jgi:cytoskeletal protein CcmA (bactofilin family)